MIKLVLNEMTLPQAQRLITTDIESMSLEDLQRFRVRLLDALRYSTGEYGEEESYKLGFLIPLVDEGGKGFIPKDKFLTTNLKYKLQEVEKTLDAIYNEDKYEVLDYDEYGDFVVIAAFPTKREANNYIKKKKSKTMVIREIK